MNNIMIFITGEGLNTHRAIFKPESLYHRLHTSHQLIRRLVDSFASFDIWPQGTIEYEQG